MIKVNKKKFWTICCICTVFQFLILIIVIMSLTLNLPVKQNEYGVVYNEYTMQLGPIREQGKYNVKLGDKLIIFQRTLQSYSITTTCLTSDKVLVTLSSTIQYKYHKENLINIIMLLFKNNKIYSDFLHNLIISSISNTCLKFTAEDYYIDRSLVDNTMSENLIKDIDGLLIGTNINFFQLTNILFPNEFSTIIQQKQNIQQNQLTAINDRNSLVTQANTKLLQAQRTADINLINANNTVNVNLNKAITDANIAETLWNQRKILYLNIIESLKYNHSQLIDYLNSENVRVTSKLYTST